MYNVIKINNVVSKKLSVRFKNEYDDLEEEKEQKQNQFQIQLEQKYELGFQNGYENAKNDIEELYNEKLLKKVNEFKKILTKTDEKISGYGEEFEGLVVRLSFEIAQKIVRREIKKESPIENVLKESLKKILGANSVIIKIHPEDFKLINDDYSKNLFFDESFSKIKFEQDDRIEQGGCAVETEIGNVDARITSQINELKKYFESNLISNQISK